MHTPSSVKDYITKIAFDNGFHTIGISHIEALKNKKLETKLSHFISNNFHGDMHWLGQNIPIRSSPQNLWTKARSIIMLGKSYQPDYDPLESLKNPNNAVISVYARGDDYHDTIKKKLKIIARDIQQRYNEDVKVFVDTAPIMEKPLAASAGLGWQGKHTNLVSKTYGSWLFLGSIFTTLELPQDTPSKDTCGTCKRCLDICPTQAFVAPYQIDARRCISYLTIEFKGIIDISLRKAMGNRIFGCDDCLAVCPWNKFAKISHKTQQSLMSSMPTRFTPDDLSLEKLIQFSENEYRVFFRKTPVRRSGYYGFLRNVLIAIGNSHNTMLAQHVQPFIEHTDTVLRATAIWSYSQLIDAEKFTTIYLRYYPFEKQKECQEEWKNAMKNLEINR